MSFQPMDLPKSQPEPAQQGILRVSVAAASQYYRSTVPIEIRDSHLELVRRTIAGKEEALPPGVYQVSAVMTDGVEDARVVRVEAGLKANVELAAAPVAAAAGVEPDLVVRSAHRPVQHGFKGGPRSPLPSGAPAPFENDDDGWPITIEARGGVLTRTGSASWSFAPEPQLKHVPVAIVGRGSVRIETRLPASTEPAGPNPCEVHLVDSPAGLRVRAVIAPQRTVARALQNMLAAGEFGPAAAMARDGAGLLQSKYSDPTGAALGSLILHKVGLLGTRIDWLRNLARDFPWLPDGRALLAVALAQREKAPTEALRLALQAGREPILFTEVFSLLMDALRRWPRDAEKDERDAVLGEMGAASPFLDWNSLTVSRVDEA